MSSLCEFHNEEDGGVVGHTERMIASVSLPENGIRTDRIGATTFDMTVQLLQGEHYVLKKRYSAIRAFHNHLKSTHAQVKQLKFPPKHLRRNPTSTFLEKRRRGLEEYFCVLLNFGPLLRRELFNFFSVNAHVEEFERLQRATPVRLAVEVENTRTEVECAEVLTESNEDGAQSDTDTSTPASVAVNSSSGRPQPADESPFAASSSSALMELIEMCFPMDEFQLMSEAVVDRLIRTRYRLDEVDSVSSDEQVAFARIYQRFRTFLRQHAHWLTIIERVTRAPTLLRLLYAFNCELDAFNSFNDHEEINWKATWTDMSRKVEECLIATWKENVGSLYTELPDASSQHDALIMLNNASELRRSSILEVAAEIAERISDGSIDATIESVPDRFIHEHEIQREAQLFSSGSSGSIYRGVWRGAKVMIKCVEVNTQKEVHSFLQEDKIWHMARHPNVVTYYGACHVSHPCFLVSEEATNGSAIKFIANQKKRGQSVIWRLMHEAALGIRFLHENSIIHGDLRCRNIVVDTNGVAKLVDFGMSSLNGSSPTPHIGPTRWAAPECLVRKQTSSYHSDKYSFGMCIIEAAIGCDPWGQLSDTEIHYELAHGQFLAQPSALNDDQWRLVTSLCDFEPDQRCTIDFAIDQLEAFALTEANADVMQLQNR